MNPLLQLSVLSAQVLVLGLQRLHVGIRGRAEALLDELDGVAGLLRLLIEPNEHFGEVIDYAGALKIFAELFLLLLSGLHGHFKITTSRFIHL